MTHIKMLLLMNETTGKTTPTHKNHISLMNKDIET